MALGLNHFIFLCLVLFICNCNKNPDVFLCYS